ncbi:nucleic acid-binding protein [Dolichospermum sp. ST_con]|nr:nucleic acid-binding protein [Dolichospermum sp. ST_con]MDD1419597.1 nucleic acid-binding protein [Dolichospermum sp. ST_sed1]MDD1425062.1 nucleic acid-binding protein [Dolichospermum sp. ST_sed9]MDD1433919.1 nucleic acid-binding protein [Dolichospermum sp. ST_sed6]MDD1441904.1 nucleic acid-binding protein [Dolichospermum sp. ST_sed3]MDD1445366.1 nucleic acid-binding protein [Dolichospermum sp. ST_sed8]MDD1455150.1 nucleic acid-binding protein [Dolichospermum sp. ST_sed7]MDD1461064.1 nucl
MRKIFADTGYWIALLNPDDDLHQKAKQITTSIKFIPLVTSEMVFTELLNAFSGKGIYYRQKAVQFINYCFDNPEIEVVIQTDELFKSGLDLYNQRPDQAWSLTDCTSFHIMSQKNILEALAYDKHFEQAGFIALLR